MTLLDLLTEFDEALEWAVVDDPLLADHLPHDDEPVEVVRSPRNAVSQ